MIVESVFSEIADKEISPAEKPCQKSAYARRQQKLYRFAVRRVIDCSPVVGEVAVYFLQHFLSDAEGFHQWCKFTPIGGQRQLPQHHPAAAEIVIHFPDHEEREDEDRQDQDSFRDTNDRTATLFIDFLLDFHGDKDD